MMNKNALKTYAVWARVQLMEQVKQKAFEYGITEDSFGDENARTIGTRALSNAEVNQRAELVSQIKSKGFKQVIEEVAYTWFNRFIALRYMEVNGYLPSRVRVFTNENNEFEPEILKEAISIELDGLDKNTVFELVEKQDNDALYKYLLIIQCNALNPLLPGMFEKISNYTELLFPNNLLRSDSVIGKMVTDIPEEDWTDQVQILGWLYQSYIAEPKDKRINAHKQYKKDDVKFVTQIFTPNWIVRYIVDNTLGKYWIERNPNSSLREKLAYYVEPKDFLSVDEKIQPEKITVYDPCMGSGHILVYAFDVLMEIYKECGYSERDAAQSIVENNLYGLDIDDRAYQLAYFAVMMKARSYDRRILTRDLRPNVYSIQDSNFLQGSWYKISSDAKFKDIFKEIVNTFIDAKEYGSILDVPAKDYDYAMSVIDDFEKQGVIDFDTKIFLDNIDVIRSLVGQAKVMSQKYDIAVTNPPYMNASLMPAKLKQFINSEFTEYKADLFSVFVVKCIDIIKDSGQVGFLTPYVWMFLSSYEELRIHILNQCHITNLVQLEYNAFEGACVPVGAFTMDKNTSVNLGEYIRLSDFKGIENQEPKTLEAVNNKNCGYRFTASQSLFKNISGSPIAYWLSDNMNLCFENNFTISNIGEGKKGLSTGDNNQFLRLWSEVNIQECHFELHEYELPYKWVPINKGGSFRKWYGNNDYVILWFDNGAKIKEFKGSVIRNPKYYFRKSITWTMLSNSCFGVRFSEQGKIFEGAGPSLFLNDSHIFYVLGFLCSKLGNTFIRILNPTMNINIADVCNLPLIVDNKDLVEQYVKSNIDISKNDWDSFEISWDFKEHPLIRLSKGLWDVTAVGASMQYYYGGHPKVGSPLELCYMLWQGECNERFKQLKANEEELNRIFIDIYGLQDELTSEVEDKDVTVRKADLQRDIKSLISYAVGCMFGRYSIEAEGLQYAGGNFNEWYKSLSANGYQLTANIVDKDNILPICDDEYFEDDIVGRFVDFIKVVYGAETLEENLRFIADALGGKGTPREVIRNYFINDFYKDHCKIYQKRPIYWMFDSGKKNGFKALVYMHRYQPDTIARMRTDYVHEQQERYRTLSESLSIEYDTATGADRTKIGKQIDKLKDQLIEIGAFEEKVHHLADQMIDIDLDDGVRVNYAKFGDILAKIK